MYISTEDGGMHIFSSCYFFRADDGRDDEVDVCSVIRQKKWKSRVYAMRSVAGKSRVSRADKASSHDITSSKKNVKSVRRTTMGKKYAAEFLFPRSARHRCIRTSYSCDTINYVKKGHVRCFKSRCSLPFNSLQRNN